MKQTKNFGALSAFIAALLFGAAAPLSKPLLDFLSDFQLAGLLYLGAALGVLPILLREGGLSSLRRIPRLDILRLIGAILLGGILGPIFLLAGLRLASAGSVSLWLNLEMVATAVIGFFFFNDHLSGKGWLASIGALAAASILAWQGGIAGVKAGGLIALACICWGFDNHLTALIDGISPAQNTFWKGLFAGGVNLMLGSIVAPLTASPAHILGGLGLGALSYGLSILLYIIAAQQLGATRSQLIFSSAPYFGLFLSMLFGEPLSIYQLISLGLFLVSMVLLFKETHSHLHRHKTQIHLHRHTHTDLHHNHEHAETGSEVKWHSHKHKHESTTHSHPHWPDLHHRHEHN
jgi:drug/metabolite transporter (DMT)-like permease